MKKLIETLAKYVVGGAIIASLLGYVERYNTVKNNILHHKLLTMESKIDELKNNTLISSHINSASKHLNDVNDSVSKFIDDFIKNIKGTGSSSNYISDSINEFYEFMSTLSTEQLGALAHILAGIFILFCIFSIVSVFYGDKLIVYFNIEKRLPSLARFIQIRRKLQHYYFLLNIILIVVTILYVIYVNLIVFTH